MSGRAGQVPPAFIGGPFPFDRMTRDLPSIDELREAPPSRWYFRRENGRLRAENRAICLALAVKARQVYQEAGAEIPAEIEAILQRAEAP